MEGGGDSLQSSLMHFLLAISIVDTALISWNHMFDVDVSILAAESFEHVEGLVDVVTQATNAAVDDVVQLVNVLVAEDVQDWKDLTKVRDKSFPNARSCKEKKNIRMDSPNAELLYPPHLFRGYHVHLREQRK